MQLQSLSEKMQGRKCWCRGTMKQSVAEFKIASLVQAIEA